MLNRRVLGVIVLSGLVGIWGLGEVGAQMKMGYINSQEILSKHKEAVDAQKKLETENEKWGRELQQMQEEFQTLQEQLDQQSLLLSQEKKTEKAQELQNLAIRIQQYQNEKWGEQGEFFKRREELLQPVFDKINEAIQKVGNDEGYDFIFDSVAGNILFAQDKYDLTQKVLDELEKVTAGNE